MPAEALAKAGAPERIRTSNPQIRSLKLYPIELRAQMKKENPLHEANAFAKKAANVVEREGFEPSRPVTQALA
jgi:hypothetical protein